MERTFRIDLISDTSTRPTPAMRRAMAEAEVGDEQRGEDPSVNRLCDRAAALMGQEAALFLPSGTMCNQIAIATHCRPGDEIITAEASHIIGSEVAGAAVFAGSVIREISCRGGIFSGDDVSAAVRARNPKSPCSRLVEVEQTNNRGGGSVWPLEAILSVTEAARAHDLALHMDGARLMNAAVASGVAARDFAAPFDSVWLDLSKGLGCPFGGVLAGSVEFDGAREHAAKGASEPFREIEPDTVERGCEIPRRDARGDGRIHQSGAVHVQGQVMGSGGLGYGEDGFKGPNGAAAPVVRLLDFYEARTGRLGVARPHRR